MTLLISPLLLQLLLSELTEELGAGSAVLIAPSEWRRSAFNTTGGSTSSGFFVLLPAAMLA